MSSSSPTAVMTSSETQNESSTAKVGLIQALQSIGEQFNDSGYSSTISSPGKSIDETSTPVKSDQPAIQARLSAFAKFASGKSDDNKILFPGLEVDDGAREAYARIQPHFEKQIRDYILAHPKRGETCYPLWIRLLMVGTSSGDADVHIVVFCKPKYKPVVRRFFQEDHVTELCGASGTGSRRFKLHVEGIAPRLRHSMVQVIADSPPLHQTMCGTPISLQHPSGRKRNATLGGVIKVVDCLGEFRLYGISVGHVLEELDIQCDEHEEQAFDDMEDYGLELIFEGYPDTLAEADDTQADSWVFAKPELFGISIEPPSTSSFAAANRQDWALFDMTSYKPNKVRGDRGRNMRTSTKAPGQTGSREVYFLSGSGPHGPGDFGKKGVLSPAAGRIALGPSLELVDAYILSITDDSGIHDGDSGSWIVDCQTLELYGHLVATDFLDEGIVVPMRDVFEDIKQHFEAESVELPSDIDMFSSSWVPLEGAMTRLPYDTLIDIGVAPSSESGYGSAVPSPSSRPSPLKSDDATRSAIRVVAAAHRQSLSSLSRWTPSTGDSSL